MNSPFLPSQSRRRTNLVFDESHFLHCLRIISDFLRKQGVMLTRQSCLRLLDHSCSCGARHTKEFLTECFKRREVFKESMIVKRLKLCFFSDRDIVRVASVGVSNAKVNVTAQMLRKREGNRGNSLSLLAPRVFVDHVSGADQISGLSQVSELFVFNYMCHKSRIEKMNDVRRVEDAERPLVWMNVDETSALQWDYVSWKAIYGALATRLLSESDVKLVGLRELSDGTSEAKSTWGLGFFCKGEVHYAILCGLGPVNSFILTEKYCRRDRRRISRLGFTHFLCLRSELSQHGSVLSFKPGTSFLPDEWFNRDNSSDLLWNYR